MLTGIAINLTNWLKFVAHQRMSPRYSNTTVTGTECVCYVANSKIDKLVTFCAKILLSKSILSKILNT